MVFNYINSRQRCFPLAFIIFMLIMAYILCTKSMLPKSSWWFSVKKVSPCEHITLTYTVSLHYIYFFSHRSTWGLFCSLYPEITTKKSNFLKMRLAINGEFLKRSAPNPPALWLLNSLQVVHCLLMIDEKPKP